MKLDGKVLEVKRHLNKLHVTIETPLNDQLALIDKDKAYTVEIKQKKQKRSLNANAYAWALCQQIAEELSKNGFHTKEDVYRKAIKDSTKPVYIVVEENRLEDFVVQWESRGVGWMCENIGTYDQGYMLMLYAGSSVYNEEEMSRLIECLKTEAEQLGLEPLDGYLQYIEGAYE